MENENIEVASMSEIAREIGINKSKIAYYIKEGLIIPIKRLDKTIVLDKKKTIKVLKKIEALKAKGKELNEIKNVFNL